MPVWKKMLIAALGALTLGGAANVVAFAAGDDPPRPGAVDVKGPCDEAEHAGEARCAGRQVLEDRDGDEREDEAEEREDEADEREDDGDEAEDHRRGHDEGQEDNSGPSENSGPGGDSDASGNSGPSENSGPGGGDNSGPGSGGSGQGED